MEFFGFFAAALFVVHGEFFNLGGGDVSGEFGAKNGEADVDQLGEYGGNIESTSALAFTQQRARVYSAARSRLLSSALAFTQQRA
ncbi:MAG: hypothetical protein ABF328_00445, partial [Akkermansiaceae bacterium]